MTTLREAAQQALEAMEQRDNATLWHQAIHALRDALAQEEQEPVAWMVYTLDGKSVCVTDNPADFSEAHRALPLYTHPPRRTGLPHCEHSCEANAFQIEIRRLKAELAAEREACADICDQHASVEGIAQRCAEQIRARGKK